MPSLNLVQRVHNIRADADLKELLDQHPDLQSASGAMPGTYSIKIDSTATPVVHRIKSAPEMYQRAMDEMLEGIDHAFAIMDDILIAGRDIAHHDLVLQKVLDRARSYNLKLNFEMVRVRKQQVQ